MHLKYKDSRLKVSTKLVAQEWVKRELEEIVMLWKDSSEEWEREFGGKKIGDFHLTLKVSLNLKLTDFQNSHLQ